MSLQERWATDQFNWERKSPQCNICKNKSGLIATICLAYTDKPKYVLFCEKECEKFEAKEVLAFEEKAVVNGMFGFCIGDLLGVPVEFKSRAEIATDPVKEMRVYGTYHQYFGTWSDDSSLTFCLLESLCNGYNLQDIAQKFVLYSDEAYWTPWGKVFDIGITTARAIEKIKAGISPVDCGGKTERDNGNGSLMRILPLAFYLQHEKDDAKKIQIIEEVSSITHAHNRAKFACVIYVEFAIQLLNGLEKNEAYAKAIDFAQSPICDKFNAERNILSNVLNGNIKALTESQISSTGYVVDTLEASLWCFLTTNTYKEAVLKAVNLGDDTDTVAAICGGLAGIYYGISNIPNTWIQTTARKKDIYDLCMNFT